MTLRKFCVSFCLLSFSLASTADAALVRVFLLGGQSNAFGFGNTSDLPTSPVNLQQPQADVEFYFRSPNAHAEEDQLITLRPGTGATTSQFGPEVTFGRGLADSYATDPNTSVAVIKYARGATDLAFDWAAGGNATQAGDGPEYVEFQNTVTAGLAALTAAHPTDTIEVSGMIWMQGERDARQGFHGAYETNLNAFIDDVRQTYGANLPFVIGQLSDGQTALPAAGLAAVQAAQANVAAADPFAELVVTNGFSLLGDDLHFNSAGQIDLGEAFATELLPANSSGGAVPEPSTLALSLLGLPLMRCRRTRRD
ncbi:MAG: hypothetical protein KDA60_13615 [Planctomycetales bacterium]|nr:hypothetical protein [Planctomycetales bacterium]